MRKSKEQDSGNSPKEQHSEA